MRFPRTIRLKNSSGAKEFYCPTPAQPPWTTEKPWWEAARERKFAAMPFPQSQPPLAGSKTSSGNPGNRKRWTWTYIEAKKDDKVTRHFLRRDPYGNLLLKEELVGQTYRILGNDMDDSYPAEPDPLFPEPPPSRALVNVHFATDFDQKTGSPTHFYYVAYKLPNGEPQLPATHVGAWHVRQKRDGSWCFLPNSYTTVPDIWQPDPNAPQKLVADTLVEKLVREASAKSPTQDTPTNGSLTVKQDPSGAQKLTLEVPTEEPALKEPFEEPTLKEPLEGLALRCQPKETSTIKQDSSEAQPILAQPNATQPGTAATKTNHRGDGGTQRKSVPAGTDESSPARKKL
jgi:hypothetical protein